MPRKNPHITHLSTLLTCSWLLAGVPAATAQPLVSEPCDRLPTDGHSRTANSGALNPGRIQVFTWNIQKSSQDGWQRDLTDLASQADLVVLQEAALEKAPLDTLSNHNFGAFAPGYTTTSLTTGVMTLSTIEPRAHCALQHVEPWLQSPKATSLGLYPLENGPDLLVANLHGVNFSLDAAPLAEQLADVAHQIERHQGPVILAGDFNTWSSARKGELGVISEQLRLNSVVFAEDSRITVFGNTLDHILVRGLEVLESETYTVDSSDHNPFAVTLRLSDTPSETLL